MTDDAVHKPSPDRYIVPLDNLADDHGLPTAHVRVVRASDYDTLEAERDALRKDALRYREWRKQALTYQPVGACFADAMMEARTPADIDAAVDAAMVTP